MLPVLKEAYLSQIESRGRSLNYQEKENIRRDLESLLQEFRELKEKAKDQKVDIKKVEEWKKRASKLWN
ncbi:hypothetical protein COT20_01075 [bacterium (Candidatus Gribaldobacteria) CG08_land_8_20_14_0_20_39_15]|uniref:Uncharacterized protein n=1 Tax=bacterium (Candidatus Gribaldobacteria) CG08_land_8_20_14_0_20_39_15 TaxID=2014273 RepID=A0A2M6XUT9_9BACT|nr:MAG: hypothetical protein COT20_01075 [bacterium (Candidatus Gribaldobacteria) CG08_land_8_20_14_0_20_39_15]